MHLRRANWMRLEVTRPGKYEAEGATYDCELHGYGERRRRNVSHFSASDEKFLKFQRGGLEYVNWDRMQGGNCLEFRDFDEGYVERLRLGDRATEEHFVTYFSELIELKLRSRLQSPQSAQDIQQETFARVMALLRKDGGIRQGDRLGALVNSICNNVMFEHHRSSRRAEPLDDVVSENLLDHQPDALRRAITRQTQQTVHQVLDTLGERERTVLRMLFVEERDKDNVCRELGVDRDYIRVLVFRAKKAFRAKMDVGHAGLR